MPRNKPAPYTLQSLKAMPLAARYDAIRECFRNPKRLDDDTSLRYNLPSLFIRRTAGKPKEGDTK